jgi:proteic killer suppression protein
MGMEVEFGDASLDRLETDGKYDAGFSQSIVKAFRLRMQTIRAAPDERIFYALKSLRFERLEGDRSHQHSIELNDHWRLIVELKGGAANRVIVIVGIEDSR